MLTYMDEFVDELLTQERVCDTILPRLAKRDILEENGDIGPRKSRLLDALEGKSEAGSERSRSRSRSRTRSGSVSGRGRSPRSDRTTSEAGSRFVSRSPSGSRKSGSNPGSPFRSRSRSISPDRMGE